MTVVAISLGSNQGDSRALLRSAIEIVGGTIDISSVAAFYRTSPVSEILQPDFLNTALVGTTDLQPADLLAVLKECEFLCGRRRTVRWGPRPLDLDLLVYGDLVSSRPELTLPHPRLRERRFYLEPLAEIAPDLVVPPDGETVAKLLTALPAEQELERVCELPGEEAGEKGA